MAATSVTPKKLTSSNSFYTVSGKGPTVSTAGASEEFSVKFVCKDEEASIVVYNGSEESIKVVMVSNSDNNGFTPSSTTITAGSLGAVRIESGFVKDSDGTVKLKVTPSDATSALTDLSFKVYAFYNAVPLN